MKNYLIPANVRLTLLLVCMVYFTMASFGASITNLPQQKSESIELNNGVKWKVDSAMLIYIRNMEKDVNDFGKSRRRDYAGLSGKLKTNINLLTSNCTMQGKAHDELHKWLLPFIDLVNEFSEAKTDDVSQKKFAEIQKSFATFNMYFQ